MLGALLAAFLHPAPGVHAGEPGRADPPASSRPAYLTRGDEVEARYRRYQTRLACFFDTFSARLDGHAPDLRARLRAAPPAPVPYGYQILPKLIADPPRPAGPVKTVSTSFSWRRTDGLIDRDLGRLQALEARLDRTAEWEQTVDGYRQLAANQKVIASHVDYNRLWQGEIARDPGGYDEQTALHDAVLERRALLETLDGAGALEPILHRREQDLSRRIDAVVHRVSPPDFVRLEQPFPHRFVVTVPVYTDIEDRAFVERFRAGVENAWRVLHGEDEFRVAVDMRHVAPDALYPGGDAPARGAHLDLARHIGRFPPGGAVLTTGANMTHVLGRSMNVGPHDTAPNILAHEFGHILGFPDGYFRGYRDRGQEGYEVLEVVVDYDDIMSAPGEGRVSWQHAQALLDALHDR